MTKIDSTVEKLLERPMAKNIMKLLADEDLSIPQIVKKMQSSDIQTIVAFFAELQHFGLIELTDLSSRKSVENKQEKSQNLLDFEILAPRATQFPPLGISVKEYNLLWDDFSRDNGQINLQQLENLTFTVPSNLKHLFKTEKPSNI
ncbi:hypothetical protein CEE45_00445 [Candidatus Heimdallarchaeota archaeon B3_Heim]|nr:MAG: hypothetical protein CEE45_00445 [Candidatus Heimdallarchaeota archaeon B3_Heim]